MYPQRDTQQMFYILQLTNYLKNYLQFGNVFLCFSLQMECIIFSDIPKRAGMLTSGGHTVLDFHICFTYHGISTYAPKNTFPFCIQLYC